VNPGAFDRKNKMPSAFCGNRDSLQNASPEYSH
jgi:hypothetical protein